MKRKLAGAAVTLLVAGLAAGCGGSGKDKTTTVAKPLTKAQYIAQADVICTATKTEIATAAKKLKDAASKTGTLPVKQVAAFLTNTSLPAYNTMLNKLRDLDAPAADAKKIDDLIAALAGAIDTTRADPTRYASNGAPDPFDKANGLAIDYGMKVCGQE
jgi:hypothetical protein